MVYEHDARVATDARLAMNVGLFGARGGRGTAICDERGPGDGFSFANRTMAATWQVFLA